MSSENFLGEGMTLRRARACEDEVIRMVDIPVCRCAAGERRGPIGGVCGVCSGAIPKWALDRERAK